MPQNIAEIVHPLIDNGMFENAETAVKSLMLEEEDGLDWKIATEMMKSWLGIKEKSLT